MRADRLGSALAHSSGEELLTTGEAAEILGTSRQHVVDLCRRGDLPFTTTGTHRRVRRGDVEALRTRTQRLTRDQRRSLWLGYAVAGRLVAAPHATIEKAKENLEHLRRVHTRGASRLWIDGWAKLLDGPVEDVLDVLTSRTSRARELRQNSPFAGVLSEEERDRALRGLNEARHHG